MIRVKRARCAARGVAVYLLEYTADETLKKEVSDYCAGRGWQVYFASSTELT